ncbi:hypothetical protein [Allomesorhizobium alhagi]|uniref:hypothetical protein n=1 Tax=Allomesorhizobium alhagi TaxID=475067 RepID=UPI001111A27D|nr:hypothetical protein [Mesorhizobium alhagi]
MTAPAYWSDAFGQRVASASRNDPGGRVAVARLRRAVRHRCTLQCVVERHPVRDPAVNGFTTVAVNPNFPVMDRHWGKTVVCNQVEIAVSGCLLQKYRWRLAVVDKLAIEGAAQGSQSFSSRLPFHEASIASCGSGAAIRRISVQYMQTQRWEHSERASQRRAGIARFGPPTKQ